MPNFEAIVKRSWQLTREYKWLWVYGLVLAAFAGGSGGSNFRSILSGSGEEAESIPENLESAADVLGVATNIFVSWLKDVSPMAWFIAGTSLVLFVIFSIAVSWIVTSWATGALIHGLNEANKGKHATLITGSPVGIKNLKNLIYLSLISLLLVVTFIAVIVAYVLISMLAQEASQGLGSAMFVLGALIFVPSAIVGFILLSMVKMYSERLVVLEGYQPWNAWKTGLSLSKSAFLPTALMGIINQVISTAVGCVSILIAGITLGIPVFILIIPVIKNHSAPSGLTVLLVVIALFIFIYANMLVRAVLTVFQYGNWNLFFAEIYAKSLEKQDEQR